MYIIKLHVIKLTHLKIYAKEKILITGCTLLDISNNVNEVVSCH